MKTILSQRFFLLIASISIIVSSCTKDSLSLVGNTGSNLTSISPIGSIVDWGLIDTENHLMVTTLNSPNITTANYSPDFNVAGRQLSFQFYSQEDGILPSGVYNFSNTDVKSPFTFDSGVLKSALINGNTEVQDISVADGFVTVVYDGSQYSFSYQVKLSTGEIVSGTNEGNMSYEDLPFRKK
jgi:hypothetical protein